MRSFAAVYLTGGVRPAARKLQVTHSSVSRHIRELEKWLGVDLFENQPERRLLSFTSQGEALGRVCLESLRLLENAVDSVREHRRQNAVTISTTPSFAARWLLPRLNSFQQAYPWIELSVVAEQKLVEPGSVGADLAIRMGKGPWPSLECDVLMDDELFPVMSARLWQDSDRPCDPSALRHLNLLHDRDPNAAWSHWLAHYSVDGLDAGAGQRFASSDLVLRAASMGLGVALARGRLAADDLATGGLVRPFGERVVRLPKAYWIVRSKQVNTSVAVGPVLEWLRSQVRRVLTNQESKGHA